MSTLKNFLWGFPAITVLLTAGLYFTYKSNFLQFRCWNDIFQLFKKPSDNKNKKGISNFSAVSTALGGSVGIGSISGVGLALAAGGCGSIFWMWLSGFFGSIIKYAEVCAAVQNRQLHNGIYTGGTMYCLKKEGKKKLSVIFAVLCIAASFGVGNLTQSAAVSDLLSQNGISKTISGFIFAIIIAFAIFGGKRSIAAINGKIVPAASLIYLLMMIFIILSSINRIPCVFYMIIKSAFGFKQVAGGISGTILAAAMRTGFSRGIFSCEAGMGSSSMAHASSEQADPHNQGLWGIFEVSADIFIISTITALGLIALDTDNVGFMFRSVFGGFGSVTLILLLTVLAFASIISWCFYGETAIQFLFDKRIKFFSIAFKIITVGCAFLAPYIASLLLWEFSDIINALMIFPNIYMLFLKRKDINLCFGTKKHSKKF